MKKSSKKPIITVLFFLLLTIKCSAQRVVSDLNINYTSNYMALTFADYISKNDNSHLFVKHTIKITIKDGIGNLTLSNVKQTFSFYIESCKFHENIYDFTLINPQGSEVTGQLLTLGGNISSFWLNSANAKTPIIFFNK